jgi:predicted RNase H-like nuclease
MTAQHSPFLMLGGIVPCPGGWLVMPARLANATVIMEPSVVLPTLTEVLDYKPTFEAAAIHAPIGLHDSPVEPYRPCDAEAREIVGWPRLVAIRPVPSRAALRAESLEAARALEPWLTKDDLRWFRWWREAEVAFQPFHQRTWFASHPELSFFMMNGDEQLTSSPYSADGHAQRRKLVLERMQGTEDLLDGIPPVGAGHVHVLRAAALLWTARRATGRAVNRLPADPTWDDTGLRMELVR